MSTRPPGPSPSNGYITVHTPACPTQITSDTHFTRNTSTDKDPAPLSPVSTALIVNAPCSPCHATPTPTCTSFPSSSSTTHVPHDNVAAWVLPHHNRPYHVATLHCTNCSNLRSGSYVFSCLIQAFVVVRCQQPVAQILVVDTCTCKVSVA